MTDRTKRLLFIGLLGAVLVGVIWMKNHQQPQPPVNVNGSDASALPPPNKDFAEWFKYWEQQR